MCRGFVVWHGKPVSSFNYRLTNSWGARQGKVVSVLCECIHSAVMPTVAWPSLPNSYIINALAHWTLLNISRLLVTGSNAKLNIFNYLLNLIALKSETIMIQLKFQSWAITSHP